MFHAGFYARDHGRRRRPPADLAAGDPGRSPTRSRRRSPRRPEQWYSFKPMWPPTDEEAAELEARAAGCSRGSGGGAPAGAPTRTVPRVMRRESDGAGRLAGAAARDRAGPPAGVEAVRPSRRRRAASRPAAARPASGRARAVAGGVVARLPPARARRRSRWPTSPAGLVSGRAGSRGAGAGGTSRRVVQLGSPRRDAAADRARAAARDPRALERLVRPPSATTPATTSRSSALPGPGPGRTSTSGSSSRRRRRSTQAFAGGPVIFVVGPLRRDRAARRSTSPTAPGGTFVAPMETVDDPALQAWFERTRGRSGSGSSALRAARRALLRRAAGRRLVGIVARPRHRRRRASRCRSSARRRRCPIGPALLAIETGAPDRARSASGAWPTAGIAGRLDAVPVAAEGTRRERIAATLASLAAALRGADRRRAGAVVGASSSRSGRTSTAAATGAARRRHRRRARVAVRGARGDDRAPRPGRPPHPHASPRTARRASPTILDHVERVDRPRRHRDHRPRADRRRRRRPDDGAATSGIRFEVVVGEEITTLGGHLLGLFLERAGQAAADASRDDRARSTSRAASRSRPIRSCPYPLCAQGCVLRRLLRDDDTAAPPGRARGVQPDDARPAVAQPGRPLRRRSTASPAVGNSDAHAGDRDRHGLDDVPGPDGRRTCGRRSRPARPTSTAPSTARRGQLGDVQRPAPQVRPRRPRRRSGPGPPRRDRAGTSATRAARHRPPRFERGLASGHRDANAAP